MFVSPNSSKEKYELRLDFQHKALTSIKILGFISKLLTDCQYLLAAWINSDKKILIKLDIKYKFILNNVQQITEERII